MPKFLLDKGRFITEPKKSGVANTIRSPEPRSILADLNKSQLANLVMKA